MRKLMKVLAAKDKTCVQESRKDVCYLTLGDKNPVSGNRYYVCLSGEEAGIKWQPGDDVMVELRLLAYKHHDQWHLCRHNDALEMIEIDCYKDTKLELE